LNAVNALNAANEANMTPEMRSTMALLVDAGNALGEGVLWCERSARIFWTDIAASRLHSLHPESGVRLDWEMLERLCCFGFTADPDVLLIGLASRLAFFNLRTGAVTAICAVEAQLPMTRVNDGRCDRQGRFVFGTMDERAGKEAIGSFYRLNADLTLERLPLPGVAIANSICFSLDGAAMYFCDSMEKIIYRWDGYASGDGAAISVFADLSSGDIAPDGATIDADGCLWSAQWGGARAVRYGYDGSIERTLHLPVSQPTCVCLAGAALDRPIVTSAREALSATLLAGEPHAGGLFHAQLEDVQGMPEARFGAAI
jgi:L-arabinonolactonase